MRKFTTIAVMLGIALSTAAAASEIYKWVDADGNVHYGDRPTGDGIVEQNQIERVAIASRRTNPEQVQAGVEARLERDTLKADARATAAEERAEAEKLKAEAEDRAEKCSTYRARLEKFVTSRRLYRVDDDGERNYLDESQMEAARAQVQQQVEEYCSP